MLGRGIIYLVRTQSFPELPPDTHTYVCVSGGKKFLVFAKRGVRTKLMIPSFTAQKIFPLEIYLVDLNMEI